MILYTPLSKFLTEYSERNTGNAYKPVAVGRYGIRTRESIYSKELAKDYSNNKLIHKNTLTVGMGSVQIDIGILTEDVTYSVSPAYHTYRIDGINADYLRYCLECRNHDMFTRFVKRGSRQGKTIDLKRWLTYEIPVHDGAEQHEIVAMLDRVSDLIAQRHQQIEEFDALVKSRFIELFGDPRDNSAGWKVYPLYQLFSVSSSKRVYQSELTESGVPFLRISDLMQRIEAGVETAELFISEQQFSEFQQLGLVPSPGDILLTSRGTLGRCYEITTQDRFYFQDGMISWLYDRSELVTNTYIMHLFQMPGFRKQIDEIPTGSTVNYLSIARIRELKVMCPDIELQEQFAAFVEQTDKSKLAVQQGLQELEILKKSLMQQYFG